MEFWWARLSQNNEPKANKFAKHVKSTFNPNKGQYYNIFLNYPEQQKQGIKLATSKEVMSEINNNIKPKKAPGYDLITGKVLNQLPCNAIMKLIYCLSCQNCLRKSCSKDSILLWNKRNLFLNITLVLGTTTQRYSKYTK